MKRTLIADLLASVGEKTSISGYVQTKRDHGKITFVDVADRSGVIQVVGTDDDLRSLSPFDVVKIEGIVNNRPESMVNQKIPSGKIEVKVEKLQILSYAQELPFDMNMQTLDLELPTLLDFRSLTLRHNKIKAIFKVQEAVVDEFRESLKRRDFTEFQSPVITAQPAEGGAEVFEVKYFDYKAYLAQSPQFYKQILVPVFERVFTVNKTLRAEPSVTTRHLTEVTTLDAEFGFIDSWEELMDMAEDVIKDIFKRVEKDCTRELELLGATIPKVSAKIPRIKLTEAQQTIFERTKRDSRKEPDLAPEDEREICKWSQDVHKSDLIFITHYPTSKRPFYTHEDPEDPKYTLSFDLLGRGTEWLTGGQRINDLETLISKAKERDIDLAKSELYLQAFKYGMPPEGGFSFGSERITMHILNLKNVREASLFPRDMERVDVRLSTLQPKKSK